MADRREYPRLEIALDAMYQARGSVLGRRATVTSLSASGVAFVTEERLELGTRIDRLHFTLGVEPATHSFELAAEVARCTHHAGVGRADEYRVGSTFLDSDPEDRERINDYVLAELASGDNPYSPRLEIEKQVAVRFDRFDDFVSQVSKDLSKTGMFIQTERPHAPGSRFDFVLQLGEDFNLVQGKGEVVWRRDRREGPERPPGMGIRFLAMDKTSESVLERLVQQHAPGAPRIAAPRQEPSQAPGELSALVEAEPDDLGAL